LKEWHRCIEYDTTSLRSVWIPLNALNGTNSWIRLQWVKGKGKPDDTEYGGPLLWDGNSFETLGVISSSSFEKTFGDKVDFAPFKSQLKIAIRFLQNDFFKLKKIYNAKNQLSVEFGAGDNWKELGSQWTPELLTNVSKLIFEVRSGHSAEEVKQFLDVVKKSTVSEVHLLDFDDSMAMEEGISGLKGSPNIKHLKYADDNGTPNQVLIDALVDLTKNLPTLESLTLSLGRNLWSSPLVVPLLESTFKLKLKTLVLADMPKQTAIDFSALLKEVAIEKLQLVFKHEYETGPSTTFPSLLNGLKGSKLPGLSISKPQFVEEDCKPLMEALMEMPELEYFAGDLGDVFPKYFIPLVKTSKTLKYIYLSGGYDAKKFAPNDLLDACAACETLKTLSLLYTNPDYKSVEYISKVIKNTNIKKLTLSSPYLQNIYSLGTVVDDLKKNTTLDYASISVFNYNTLSYTHENEIKNAWVNREATFIAHAP
jgi:hypothetical protein